MLGDYVEAKSNQGGIETVVGYAGVTYLVGQNRTKVGLKQHSIENTSHVAVGAKSNQGGIETYNSHVRVAFDYLGKIEPRWD